jgi:hypothetical protein
LHIRPVDEPGLVHQGQLLIDPAAKERLQLRGRSEAFVKEIDQYALITFVGIEGTTERPAHKAMQLLLL